MMAVNEEQRPSQQQRPMETGSFFFVSPANKDRIGSMTTAESSQKTGHSGSNGPMKRNRPIISHKLMRILDRVSEEDSFKDEELYFPQKPSIRNRISQRDKSISLDENKMYGSKQDEFSFGRLDEEKATGSYLIEAHDASKRNKLAKLAYRINAAYKHSSMEGPGLMANARVPRSAGSTVEAMTQPDRLDIVPPRVQFNPGLQNSSFKLTKVKKPSITDCIPTLGKGPKGKADSLRRDTSLQILNLVPQGTQKGRGSAEFTNAKRQNCQSSDSPRNEEQVRESFPKNRAIENLTKKYLQRISINSTKIYEKKLAESQLQSRVATGEAPKESFFFSKHQQPEAGLHNLSISIQAVKKRPKRSQLAKAFGN